MASIRPNSNTSRRTSRRSSSGIHAGSGSGNSSIESINRGSRSSRGRSRNCLVCLVCILVAWYCLTSLPDTSANAAQQTETRPDMDVNHQPEQKAGDTGESKETHEEETLFPEHWGTPPVQPTSAKTKDGEQEEQFALPSPIKGFGPARLVKWVEKQLHADKISARMRRGNNNNNNRTNKNKKKQQKAKKTQEFPAHWGSPPKIQTKDLRPLPPPFQGSGSSTLVKWIKQNKRKDKKRANQNQSAGDGAAEVEQEAEAQDPPTTTGGETKSPYPEHWGQPPLRQTRDRRPLPPPFEGFGSGTLVKWIKENQKKDQQAGKPLFSKKQPDPVDSAGGATESPYPEHWGQPPLRQTRDRRPLPAPFTGFGSGTLVKWIKENQRKDAGETD